MLLTYSNIENLSVWARILYFSCALISSILSVAAE